MHTQLDHVEHGSQPDPRRAEFRGSAMKALVKSKPEPGLWLEDMAIPHIDHDEVLIRVRKTGICGTDLHIYRWDGWAQRTIPVPMIVGHEFSGEIVEAGRQVTDLHVGQRVSGEAIVLERHRRLDDLVQALHRQVVCAFDAVMHIVLGWEYRGRLIQQGVMGYCAFEGAEG